MRIGVDLGGTKTEIIALADDGKVRLRRRIATPSGGYRDTLAAVVALVDMAERELGCRASVGVGTPGAISPASGLIKNANSTCLNGQALDRDLSAALGRPVRIANDANCMALSEAVDGAAAGAGCVFGVIIGTGVGGGVVIDTRVRIGPNAIAGEWGHMPLPWPSDDERPGPSCYCGRAGCVETFLSGPGLAADHLRVTGEALEGPAIALGDTEAKRATLERHADRFARSLAVVLDVLDPDVVVLGGGVGQMAHLYDALPARLARYVFSDVVRTRIVPPMHGDSSGVRGAAWLGDCR